MNEHLANLIYCFDFKLKDGREILLTSFEDEVNLNNKKYKPYSAINFKNFIRKKNAVDIVIIKGMWEDEGINKNLDLRGSELKITALLWGNESKKISLSTYHFSEHTKYETEFEVVYLGILTKFNDGKVNFYSKLCRAQFGDKKCGLDLATLQDGSKCDKKFITCCNIYDNAVNFRGEPFIPEGQPD